MIEYDEYEDIDFPAGNVVQKITRTTKAPKQKDYKKERKEKFRKEKQFKKNMNSD